MALIAVLAGPSCRATRESSAPIVQPGPPGQSSRTIDARAASDLSGVRHTEADVRFIQGMIAHHMQALEMTALVPSRTKSPEMRKLAERIQISQEDEIKMMREWLTQRGAALPDPHAHHAAGAHLMPGMLSPEEMERLEGASGAEFDRLFLELMIKHHEGALTMVNDLFATAGAGQEPEIFGFASDVEADQQMEIDRMLAILMSSKEQQK